MIKNCRIFTVLITFVQTIFELYFYVTHTTFFMLTVVFIKKQIYSVKIITSTKSYLYPHTTYNT